MLAFKHGRYIRASPDLQLSDRPEALSGQDFLSSGHHCHQEADMSIQTVELNSTRRPKAEAGAVIAYLGATAIAVAAVWYGLAVHGISQPRAPQADPKAPAVQSLHLFYRWFASTLPQERLYTVIAIAGFGCLAAVAVTVGHQLGGDRPAIPRTSAFGISAGALLWICAHIVLLGGHRAIGLMATHGNPIQSVNSIAFAIDSVVSALSLAAFALIGAGLLGLAYAAWPLADRRIWAGLSAVLGLLMLVLAWSYASGPGNLSDWLLLVSGAVAVPGWLISTQTLPKGTPQSA
jgi:hypothetical protein